MSPLPACLFRSSFFVRSLQTDYLFPLHLFAPQSTAECSLSATNHPAKSTPWLSRYFTLFFYRPPIWEPPAASCSNCYLRGLSSTCTVDVNESPKLPGAVNKLRNVWRDRHWTERQREGDREIEEGGRRTEIGIIVTRLVNWSRWLVVHAVR